MLIVDTSDGYEPSIEEIVRFIETSRSTARSESTGQELLR